MSVHLNNGLSLDHLNELLKRQHELHPSDLLLLKQAINQLNRHQDRYQHEYSIDSLTSSDSDDRSYASTSQTDNDNLYQPNSLSNGYRLNSLSNPSNSLSNELNALSNGYQSASLSHARSNGYQSNSPSNEPAARSNGYQPNTPSNQPNSVSHVHLSTDRPNYILHSQSPVSTGSPYQSVYQSHVEQNISPRLSQNHQESWPSNQPIHQSISRSNTSPNQPQLNSSPVEPNETLSESIDRHSSPAPLHMTHWLDPDENECPSQIAPRNSHVPNQHANPLPVLQVAHHSPFSAQIKTTQANQHAFSIIKASSNQPMSADRPLHQTSLSADLRRHVTSEPSVGSSVAGLSYPSQAQSASVHHPSMIQHNQSINQPLHRSANLSPIDPVTQSRTNSPYMTQAEFDQLNRAAPRSCPSDVEIQLRDQIKQLQSFNHSLSRSVDERINQLLKDLTAKNSMLSANQSIHQSINQANQAMIDSLGKQIHDRDAVIQNQSIALSSSQSKIDELMKHLSERDVLINSLHRQIAELQSINKIQSSQKRLLTDQSIQTDLSTSSIDTPPMDAGIVKDLIGQNLRLVERVHSLSLDLANSDSRTSHQPVVASMFRAALRTVQQLETQMEGFQSSVHQSIDACASRVCELNDQVDSTIHQIYRSADRARAEGFPPLDIVQPINQMHEHLDESTSFPNDTIEEIERLSSLINRLRSTQGAFVASNRSRPLTEEHVNSPGWKQSIDRALGIDVPSNSFESPIAKQSTRQQLTKESVSNSQLSSNWLIQLLHRLDALIEEVDVRLSTT